MPRPQTVTASASGLGAGLLAFLQARGDNYAAALAEPEVIRVALDKFHAEHDAPIAGAREIALFPPMTGG